MTKSLNKNIISKEPEINLVDAIEQLAEEKHIDKEIIYNAIRDGISKVYEKKFDPDAELEITFDRHSGEIKIFKKIKVVKKVEDDLLEISISDAKQKYGENTTIDDIVYEPIDSREFSRLAVILGSQIIKQNIREAEKDSILKEYTPHKGEIMYGEVSAVEDNYILIAVDRTYAFLPLNNCIPGDHFEVGDKICFLAEDVIKSKNAGQIKASRIANDFLTKLLEIEVSEILEGIVQVKSVARNPGVRSKIAVFSTNQNIDAIGACVGPKGIRINTVSEKLNGEKIDICLWSENPDEFIINALAPVKVISIDTKPDVIVDENVKFKLKDSESQNIKYRKDVIVPDSQFSLAIGKKGSSAKLVAKLTKWKLNVISKSNAESEGAEILWNGNLTPEELEIFNKKNANKNLSKLNPNSVLKNKSGFYNKQGKNFNSESNIKKMAGNINLEIKKDPSINKEIDNNLYTNDTGQEIEKLSNIVDEISHLEEKKQILETEDEEFYENINYDDYDKYYDK